MQLGMIGLGRMGANLVKRLMAAGHECVVYDVDPAAVRRLRRAGAVGAAYLAELVTRLEAPRIFAPFARRAPKCRPASTWSAGLHPLLKELA